MVHITCISLCVLFFFIASTRAAECESVVPQICSSFGYNTTKFPNTLGHNKAVEAWQKLRLFLPLITVKCSPQLLPFLCSLHFPPCFKMAAIHVPPCRSLCVGARSGCEPLLLKYGAKWPEYAHCEEFPERGLCFQPESQSYKEQTEKGALAESYDGSGEQSMEKTEHDELPIETRQQIETEIRADKELEKINDGALIGTTCHHIPSPMCSNIGYNTTRLPNKLGHVNPREAAMEVQQFHPLVQNGCSPHLASFLCSVYFPQCLATEVVSPCRSLCLKVRLGCEPLMRRYGFQWPEILRCDRFPESGRCFSAGEDLQTAALKKTKSKKAKSRKAKHGKNKGKSWRKSSSKNYRMRMLSDEPSSPGSSRANSRSRTRNGPHVRACLSFESDLCPKIPYTLGGYPNLLDHKNPRQAESQMRALLPLIKTGCSVRLMDFLCGVHFPECYERRVVAPCKSLCDEVSSSCTPALIKLGFRWPQRLACRNFPHNGDCFGKGDEPIIVLPSSIVNVSSPSPTNRGRPRDRLPAGNIRDQPVVSAELSPILADLLNRAFMNPFMEWIKSSTVLNNDQADLAVEQTKVAKLREQKLGLEIDHLKKETENRTSSERV